MSGTGMRSISPGADAPRPFRRRGTVLPTLIIASFTAYFLLPVVWLVVASTKSNTGLFNSFALWFTDFDLFSNIRDTLTHDDGVYLSWLRNTALYSLASALGTALLATAAGYGFAVYDFRGKRILFWMILGSIMVPGTALAIPTYLMFSHIGLVNTPWAVILPSLLSPFGVYLMRVYTQQGVPLSLLEAARLDGAGEVRILIEVASRLLVPGFVTVLLLSFVHTWNNYFLPLVMLSDPQWYPVTVGLAQWNSVANAAGSTDILFATVITGALIAIIPLIVSFFLLQRYWQAGLTVGSLKQ